MPSKICLVSFDLVTLKKRSIFGNDLHDAIELWLGSGNHQKFLVLEDVRLSVLVPGRMEVVSILSCSV